MQNDQSTKLASAHVHEAFTEDRDRADNLVSTSHELVTSSGTAVAYTATVGTMLVGEETTSSDGTYDGVHPKAHVFITSYVRDNDGRQERPVTFVFNGGPGSPSLWLNLGLFGPRRVAACDVGSESPLRFGLEDNPETMLTETDLVFIDPMMTGYSRPVAGTDLDDSLGYLGDRNLVADVIRLWTTRNARWLSPKFLAGESYGTLRAAALAGHLSERHDMAFNGVILLSSVLDMGASHFTEENDVPYITYLPTYAAIAWYHGFHEGQGLRDVVREAEDFASTDYMVALARGARLSESKRQAIADRVAQLSGLDIAYVLRANLRIEHRHFFAELLRTRGLAVGRLDARFTAPPGDLNRDVIDVDPSYRAIQFPYAAAANHYFQAELKYEPDVPYEILTDRVKPWSYAEFENASVTSAENLARVMRTNPVMKVYVAFGYFDGATPFAAAEHTLAHLRIPDDLRSNITREYYEAGHMMYVHEPSRIAQSEHISSFIRSATRVEEAN